MIAITRFFMRYSILVKRPILAEGYSTQYRAYGISFAVGFGKIGAVLSPFVIYHVFLIDKYSPFLVLAAF